MERFHRKGIHLGCPIINASMPLFGIGTITDYRSKNYDVLSSHWIYISQILLLIYYLRGSTVFKLII